MAESQLSHSLANAVWGLSVEDENLIVTGITNYVH